MLPHHPTSTLFPYTTLFRSTFSLDPLTPDSTGGVTGSVGWHFSVTIGRVECMAAGQQLTQKYDVTIDDGHGGATPQTVTITITGSNDAPVITSAAQAGPVSEQAGIAGSSATNAAAGAVTFTDLDLTDHHTTSFAAQGAGYLGTFSLDPLTPDSTGGVTGSVGWHFSVTDGALDFLAAELGRASCRDRTNDSGPGGATPQTETRTTTGRDDTPVH